MISPTEYSLLADDIDSAQQQVNDILGNLFSMHNHLEDNDTSTINDEKVEMLTTIDETYQLILNDNYVPSLNVIQTVTSLQQHISTHYGDVNDFLSQNNITVGPFFADLSALAGFVINPSNISN